MIVMLNSAYSPHGLLNRRSSVGSVSMLCCGFAGQQHRIQIVRLGSYMAECRAFSQELLFVLWWCGQDGFCQFFIIGSRFSRTNCNYFK